MRYFLLFCCLWLVAGLPSSMAQNPLTVFEQSRGQRSATYEETIRFYRQLDGSNASIRMDSIGPTDTQYPLHVVYYSNDGRFAAAEWKKQGKIVLLVNNGIHPGEPDGIDASMMLLRDAAAGKLRVPDSVVLAVIPVFNIGGMLNRGSFSRANQQGPEAYGFRGNAQYLDLNRDFIKMDALETQSLVRLFHELDPDIFIDNHVSNGADYQHVMTLLSTQADKLGTIMGRYLREELEPAVYTAMKQKGYDLVPYVNVFAGTPERGWMQFLEPPRFASGFAALFQTFAFVPETHMLKPFRQRVEATYALMECMISIAAKNKDAIRAARRKERSRIMTDRSLPISWKADTTKKAMIPFKGYEAGYKPSQVSGQPRLYYDRSKPFTRNIPFCNVYVPELEVRAPKAYVIPRGWQKVIDRLKTNGVSPSVLDRDTVWSLGVYHIEDYQTAPRPYEGHYLHRDVQVRKTTEKVQLRKGDWIVYLQERNARYLVETLEPQATDAFFAWNFFDAVLQQKEYFSDYVFEDEAAQLLARDPQLKQLLEEQRKSDTAFAKNGAAQLDFVYRHSPYYEPGHMRYPVYRVE